MRRFRKEMVPAKERTVIEAIICDLCGAEGRAEGNWAKSSYDVSEVTISLMQGNNYGSDGGDITETSFDICPSCFKSVVMPFLKDKGAVPIEEDSKW